MVSSITRTWVVSTIKIWSSLPICDLCTYQTTCDFSYRFYYGTIIVFIIWDLACLTRLLLPSTMWKFVASLVCRTFIALVDYLHYEILVASKTWDLYYLHYTEYDNLYYVGSWLSWLYLSPSLCCLHYIYLFWTDLAWEYAPILLSNRSSFKIYTYTDSIVAMR